MNEPIALENPAEKEAPACMSRRQFLLRGASLLGAVAAATLPGLGWAKAISEGERKSFKYKHYPEQRICALGSLKKGAPVHFQYPSQGVENMLVKLGVEAGGGVGPGHDIVAFNTQCTHMGGPLKGSYKDAYQVLGACPMHLSTFDLTKHGMVVSGQATQSIPQVLLEIRDGYIYAVGVMGLLFGFHDNLAAV